MNRVRIPDGTAAVCAESEARWRKPVIGKPRRQSLDAEDENLPMRESEDLLERSHFCLRVMGMSFFVARKNGRGSLCTGCRGFLNYRILREGLERGEKKDQADRRV